MEPFTKIADTWWFFDANLHKNAPNFAGIKHPFEHKKEQPYCGCSFCIVDEYCNFVDKLTVSEYKFLLLYQVIFTAFVQVNCLASIVHFAHINSARTYLCRVGNTCPFARSSRRGRHAR